MVNKKDTKDIKILIVSDAKHFITTVRQSLTICGIKKIAEADVSNKVLNELTLRIPDVMIVSWSFNPLSGIELCKFIRCNPQSPARYLPIIMANEFSDKNQIKTAIDAGVNELLVMPFSPKNILDKINYVIEKPRAFIESPSYFGPDRRRKDNPNYKGPNRRKKAGGLTPEQIEALLNKK